MDIIHHRCVDKPNENVFTAEFHWSLSSWARQTQSHLSAMVLDADHDGTYLASRLTEAITRWGLQRKVHLGVRDNGSNMVAAMRIGDILDMGCVAHTLQLVIHDALFKQTSVESLIKESRKIVTHFKHSEQACRKLNNCQIFCDGSAP